MFLTQCTRHLVWRQGIDGAGCFFCRQLALMLLSIALCLAKFWALAACTLLWVQVVHSQLACQSARVGCVSEITGRGSSIKHTLVYVHLLGSGWFINRSLPMHACCNMGAAAQAGFCWDAF